MTRSSEGVTVTGLEIHPVNAVHMFLHHLQLAVSFLEATALSEEQVCKQINTGHWTGLSDTMRKFCDTVAHGCFVEFEWNELDGEDKILDSLTVSGMKVMTIDPNDPNSMKMLHDLIAGVFGEDTPPRR